MGHEEGHVLNFIQGVQIKRKEGMGRGVFASRDLKEGELIAVEKAIAIEYQYKDMIGSSKTKFKAVAMGV